MAMGMQKRDVISRLSKEGWHQKRRSSGHTQWVNDKFPERRVTTSYKMTDNNVRSIFQQAGWEWRHKEDAAKDRKSKEIENLKKENDKLRANILDALNWVDDLTKEQDSRTKTKNLFECLSENNAKSYEAICGFLEQEMKDCCEEKSLKIKSVLDDIIEIM